MLQLLRKYQKFFFGIVAFFLIASFSFFGTFSAFLQQRDQTPNREVGTLVDGMPLMERKLQAMNRLLQYGVEEGGRAYNLLNGSVVHKDIMLSGIGEVLTNHYFEELEEELEMKWKRMKNYTPYTHPYAPYISAQKVWSQYCPELNDLLVILKICTPC